MINLAMTISIRPTDVSTSAPRALRGKKVIEME
jgi:hypothetical protein